MTWLREYMASDAAKNAKSPFPGMKKEASVYVKPRDMKVVRGDILPIMVRASLATKTIEKVDLYLGSQLIATMTEAPYYTEYNVPSNATAGGIIKHGLVGSPTMWIIVYVFLYLESRSFLLHFHANHDVQVFCL